MNISLSRRMKVNLGNYESFEFSAQATVNHGDMGYTDQEVVEEVKKDSKFLDRLTTKMHDRVEATIDRLLIADIKAAQDITEETRSFVLRAFTSGADEVDVPPSKQSTRRPRRPSASR